MNTFEILNTLQNKALNDNRIKTAFLNTQLENDPLDAFCKVCRELGYEIYPMDVVNAGESFYAAMRRSTNGGGENAPMLEGEDDFYELFIAAIK